MLIQAQVESTEHVCCRYRLRAFEPGLRATGHTMQYAPLPRTLFRPLWEGRKPDLIVWQRNLPSWWQRQRLKHLRDLPVVFDLDDAVWLRDSYSPRGTFSRKRATRFAGLMRCVRAVSAGNPYLAGEALRHNPALEVAVIPTCVEPAAYPVATHADATVRLVWIGSSSTLHGLERVRPLLEGLGRIHPGLRLRLICDRFPTFDPLPVEAVRWSPEAETRELAGSSIGISWIPDDPWSRGKCGLKVLQYMAAGLPVVANPVGVHPEMITDGVTGFLPDSEQGWQEAVAALARDPELRLRMGRAGRKVVEERYSVQAGTRQWLRLLARLQGTQPQREAA